MAQIEIHITLREEVLALARLDKEEVATDMQRLLLIELIREGRVTYGKAAELLGISQAEFLAHMSKHEVSPFQFTPDELSTELEPIE